MFQQLILIGNLGRDPEMRYTASGIPVTNFSLAVNRVWTGQDGQRQDKTTWFRVTAWRRDAETVSQYLTKGSRVLVVGEIEDPDVWQDRDGNYRASLDVTARQIRFMGSRADGGGDFGNSYSDPQDESYSGGGSQSGGQDDGPNDIPF